MGRLSSATDWSTLLTVDGVRLGVPIISEGDAPYAWDDPRLPTGVIDSDGNVVIAEFPAE